MGKYVLHRVGNTKRQSNFKTKILPPDFLRLKEEYLVDIMAVVEIEEIPDSLIINWDQTATKIVSSSS